jgi:hypothetical protein
LTEAGKFSNWNEPAFIQLQNLILRFSRAYHEHNDTRRTDETSFLATKRKLVKEFEDDLIPRLASNWSDERAKEKKKPKGKRYKPEFFNEDDFTRAPGFYTPVLKHFLKALPALEKTKNAGERAHILSYLNKRSGRLLTSLGK